MLLLLPPRKLRSAIAIVLATSITSVHVTVPALAQVEEEEELSRARAKFQRATELEQGGNWAGALQLFREVGQFKMTPQVRFHIALCEENLGKLVAALGGYELALADADSVGPGFRSDVESSIDLLKARIPKLVIERGKGAEAATIELDGISLGASSIGVAVPIDPGPHALRASAPGFEPYSSTVEVDESSQETVVVTLEATEAPPPPPPTSDSSARADSPPPEGFVLDRDFWMYSAFGAGGVFLIGGGLAFLMRSQKLDDIEQLCGDTCEGQPPDIFNEALNARDQAQVYRIVGTISLGLGVAGIGAGTYLLLTRDQNQKESAKGNQWHWSPTASGADIGGLSVSSTF